MRPPKAHQHLYLIQPAVPPAGVPEGAVPIEALVFSPSPRPADVVLKSYCEARGLDVGKFRCRPVSFDRKNLKRDGRGTLRILDENGKTLKAIIEWKR